MILTLRRQRRALAAMRDALRGSDPRLVARFAIFTRLNADEEIPAIERVRAWPLGRLRSGGRLLARHFTRSRLRRSRGSRWLRGVVFIPLAAVLLVVLALLLAGSGGRLRCAPPRPGQRAVPVTAAPLPQIPGCSLGQVPALGAGRLESGQGTRPSRGAMFISLWAGTTVPS